MKCVFNIQGGKVDRRCNEVSAGADPHQTFNLSVQYSASSFFCKINFIAET